MSLFDIGNKLGNAGFITGSVGFALIAFSVLCFTYFTVSSTVIHAQKKQESILLSDLDGLLQRYKIESSEEDKEKCRRDVEDLYDQLQQYPELTMNIVRLFARHSLFKLRYDLYINYQKLHKYDNRTKTELYDLLEQNLKSYKHGKEAMDEILKNKGYRIMSCNSYKIGVEEDLESISDIYPVLLQKHPELKEHVNDLFSKHGLQKSDLGIDESSNVSANLQDANNSSGIGQRSMNI